MMTIIRPILRKFTWNLLRQEDLLTRRELNRRLRILISTCSRNRMFPRLSLLFRFKNIRIFRFRRLCVLRHHGMCRTRSTGAHPNDRRPKAKLRFPDVTGIQPPPVCIVSKPKAKAEPVVIQPPAPAALPGQGLKEKGPPIDADIEPVHEPGSSSGSSDD